MSTQCVLMLRVIAQRKRAKAKHLMHARPAFLRFGRCAALSECLRDACSEPKAGQQQLHDETEHSKAGLERPAHL